MNLCLRPTMALMNGKVLMKEMVLTRVQTAVVKIHRAGI
jgi:hypothetical protein